MSSRAWVDPSPGPALGASRTRVLELLREAPAAMSVHDIAARTTLHPSTVRFHLDGLVEIGLADRSSGHPGRRGRPYALYRATTSEPTKSKRSYRLLAAMLTSLISDTFTQPEPPAIRTGRAWGSYLVDRPAPSHPVDAADALNRLTRMLIDVGFTLDPVVEGDTPVMALRHCPFREIAEEHRDIACALHLGLMQGALDEINAPLTTDKLEPLVEPSLCLAHLGPTCERAADQRTRTSSSG